MKFVSRSSGWQYLVDSIRPKYLSTGFHFLHVGRGRIWKRFGRFEKVFIYLFFFFCTLGTLQRMSEGISIRQLGSPYFKIHFILNLKFSGPPWVLEYANVWAWYHMNTRLKISWLKEDTNLNERIYIPFLRRSIKKTKSTEVYWGWWW